MFVVQCQHLFRDIKVRQVNGSVYAKPCCLPPAQTVLRSNDRRGMTRPSFRSILQPCLKSCSYESTPIFGLMPASSAFNLRNSSHKQIHNLPKTTVDISVATIGG